MARLDHVPDIKRHELCFSFDNLENGCHSKEGYSLIMTYLLQVAACISFFIDRAFETDGLRRFQPLRVHL